MTTVFLPFRGEFGQMLMTYVRWVHGIKSDHKVVCCRRGDEALFPSAREFFYDWVQVHDDRRNTKFLMSTENDAYLQGLEDDLAPLFPGADFRYPLDHCKPQRYPWSQEHNFFPIPRCPPPLVYPQVLVAPRYRKHGAHRNYEHWNAVIDGLEDQGFKVGLLGTPGTSVERPGIPENFKAWGYPDNLGVTLHWMARAQVVLCTDSGIAHLAVLAGAPLQVIYGKAGVEAGKEEWHWAFDHMKAHAVAYCEPIIGGWDDPVRVIVTVLTKAIPPRGASCRPRAARYPEPRSTSAASTT